MIMIFVRNVVLKDFMKNLKKKLRSLYYRLANLLDLRTHSIVFYENIKRVIKYLPVIWKHRNWDYGYIFRFQQKLHEDLYDGIYTNGHHLSSRKDKRTLKTIINLYKRLYEDNYAKWQYDYYNEKYGPNKMTFEPIAGSEDKPHGPYSRLRFSRDERITPEQKKLYNRDIKRFAEMEVMLRKQDLKMLGELLGRHSKKFWD